MECTLQHKHAVVQVLGSGEPFTSLWADIGGCIGDR